MKMTNKNYRKALAVYKPFLASVGELFKLIFSYILIIIKILYMPIFYIGTILLIITRVQLAIAYAIILDYKKAKNIIKFLFK